LQGTLRYAYKKSKTYLKEEPVASEKEEAEGAVFYASILPMIAECNSTAADIIYDEMKIRWPATDKFNSDYSIVKEAFESVYSCSNLKIWCREVGSLYTDTDAELPYPDAGGCCQDNLSLPKKKSCNKKFNDGKTNLYYKRCTKQRTKGKYMKYWCPLSCNNTSPGITPPGFDIPTCLWYTEPDFISKK